MKIVVFKWKEKVNTPLPSRDSKKINNIVYDGNYVNNHYENIGKVFKGNFQYICVTDDPSNISSEIEIIPLWDYLAEFGGCLRRLYLYSEEAKKIFGPKIFTCDLDTVFVNDFSHLFRSDADLIFLRSRNPEKQKSNHIWRLHPGFAVIKPGVYDSVWKDIQENTLNKLNMSRNYFTGTDQSWVNYHLNFYKPNLKIEYLDDSLGFYEARNLRTNILPENAVCVLWSGPRDPYQPEWKQKFRWLKEYI